MPTVTEALTQMLAGSSLTSDSSGSQSDVLASKKLFHFKTVLISSLFEAKSTPVDAGMSGKYWCPFGEVVSTEEGPDPYWRVFPVAAGLSVIANMQNDTVLTAKSPTELVSRPFDFAAFNAGDLSQFWDLQFSNCNPRDWVPFTAPATVAGFRLVRFSNRATNTVVSQDPGSTVLQLRQPPAEIALEDLWAVKVSPDWMGKPRPEMTYAHWENQIVDLPEPTVSETGQAFGLDVPYLTGFSFTPYVLIPNDRLQAELRSQGVLPGWICPYSIALNYQLYRSAPAWNYDNRAGGGEGTLAISDSAGWSRENTTTWANTVGASLTFTQEAGVVFAKVGFEQQLFYEHNWGGSETNGKFAESTISRSFAVAAGHLVNIFGVTRRIDVKRVWACGGSTELDLWGRPPSGDADRRALQLRYFSTIENGPKLSEVTVPTATYYPVATPPLPSSLRGTALYVGSWFPASRGYVVRIMAVGFPSDGGLTLATDRVETDPGWSTGTGTVRLVGQGNEVAFALGGGPTPINCTAVYSKDTAHDRFGVLTFVSGPLAGDTWRQYDSAR